MDEITAANYEPLGNIKFDQTLARIGHINRLIKAINRTPIVQVVSMNVAPTIDIDTSYTSTCLTFNQLVDADILFTCSALVGNSIGDSLNVITIIDITAPSVKLTFDTASFYSTQCGGPVMPIDVTGLERNIVTFIFDGQKWVSTFDNC